MKADDLNIGRSLQDLWEHSTNQQVLGLIWDSYCVHDIGTYVLNIRHVFA